MTTKKRSILIVDDDKDICRTLKDIFGTKGYDPEAAYDCLKAAELAKKKAFDIALIDLIMEEPDGICALTEIRRLRPDTLCFMITAYPGDRRIKEALANGALRVFKKPLNIEEMIKIFDEEIAKKNK
jgi:DNA-binding NtrC family response regulator